MKKKRTKYTLKQRMKQVGSLFGLLLLLIGGLAGLPPSGSEVADALTLPEGATQVGTINNAPVIKSPTDNMASQTFQDILAGLLEGAGNPTYIINQAAWGSSTSLANGKPLSSISSAATTILGADGFLPNDSAIEIPVGGKALIRNVGTALKPSDGTLVPISLGITVNSATEPDGTPYETVLMGAKSQNSVITLGWGSIVRGGSNTGGGQTEGGAAGGESSDGTLMGYIESISYTLTFLNSDTGQPLPENDTLMPIKNSDIDANQLATMDGNNALGYVLSPDTALTQVGNGFRSTSDGAINEDSSDLTENSYVVLKKYNNNAVQYKYMDGAGNHLDIVSGHFGDTPFKISELLGGFLEINKTVAGFGNKPWNSNYSFDKLLFDVKDKDGKVLDTIKLDKNGYGKSKRIMKGNYTVVERSTGWSATGQTVRANESTIIKTGETTILKLENKPVVGQNTLQKVDQDTGKAQNGKADLTSAIYQLFYNDDATGASPHKKGDPVKWSDKPAPKLLTGEKVTSALVGGKTVNFGDAVALKVDKTSLQVSVGNLALGKYTWKEIDAGEGYTVDSTIHNFEIKYKDEKTENVVAPDVTSKEREIDAAIKLNKMFTLPENEGGSGANDIEFVANPLEGTIAEPVTMVTGVDPITGDDGYAFGNLVYGDWVLEEKSEPEGRKKIRPIYIRMTTDREKDRLTITASYEEDPTKPVFSKREYTLQDSSTEKNPNSQGTVGSITNEKPTISLSTIHLNNNPEKPEEPTTPTPPTKDVTKTDKGESINEGNVALNSDFFYELNSSILKPNRQDTTTWTIHDDYDENFDRYNGWFKLYATTDFDTYKAGDELPNEFVKAEDKDGKVLFTAQKAFLDVVNKHKDKEVGFSIHASFYRFKASDEVLNTFIETVNDIKQDSNQVVTKTPKPEPHKYDLSKEKVDLTGDSLLDDDSEMKDRYAESNKDPFNDKTDNNEKENINTTVVKAGDTLVYQLWLDTRPFDETSKLTSLKMVDTYDKEALTLDTKKIKVYNAKGEDVTKLLKIEDTDKGLVIAANVFTKAKNSKGEEVSIVDTKKLPFGDYYKIDVPMTVKDSLKAGYEIINTADQQWTDSDGTDDHHITEKRVNKTPGAPTPKKEEPKNPVEKVAAAVLPNTGDSPQMLIFKVIGWVVVLSVCGYFIYDRKKKNKTVDNGELF
ncbi:LPXTG cell wall anchor domain-containing protein [Enterococcus plantarum]|uniref:LPXTG cell wall anchor domain-containing protein n=1 Tax=Enterococcus plantarum TaxID=1077675 RepID=UPI001A9036B9|nr:LPXTG cell wall anchor domain-containing protein [Enterococcus plantarum]MBO0422725.1 LPXTG cell wall anchor domain-containing protein [Enterococcus plantarum]